MSKRSLTETLLETERHVSIERSYSSKKKKKTVSLYFYLHSENAKL